MKLKFAGLGAVAAVAVMVGLSMSGAMAEDRRYATGAKLTPPELKQSIAQAPVFRDFLPQAVDLSKYMPPVGDQGNQGSCVGWATAYAARAYYAEQVEHRDTALPQNVPSPAWLYNLIHEANNCDSGSLVPDAMEVLRSGALSLKEFPYDDTKCPRPLPPLRAKATDFKIDSYEAVFDQQRGLIDLDGVKGALAKGNPVVVVGILDKAFMNLNPRHKVWHADADSPSEGGHAFTIVGYDDRTKIFKFINSWNTSWGDQGYGYLTYDTFLARIAEGYVMHLPGDPEIALAEADFSPAPVEDVPVFTPPLLNVHPTSASRDVLATEASVDVGPLACGKVDIATDADGNSVATGFVGTEAELDRVGEALKGKVDDNQVALAPWPACELKLTLASQLGDSDVPQTVIDPEAPKVGDALQIGVQSPGFASYLYAAYFSADGTVLNLTQPTSLDLKAKAPHTQLKFGDQQPSGMALTVSKPVGAEMLVVVASEKPLFAAALPDSLTDRQFLSSLRTALLAGDAGRVTATVLPVTTLE
jgi:hypothetical protein